MGNGYAFRDGVVTLMLDTRAYRLAAIKKAAYRLADRCTVVIERVDDNTAHLQLSTRAGLDETSADVTVRAFYQELLDQELREVVADETGPIRSLILAQAFSRTDLISRE